MIYERKVGLVNDWLSTQGHSAFALRGSRIRIIKNKKTSKGAIVQSKGEAPVSDGPRKGAAPKIRRATQIVKDKAANLITRTAHLVNTDAPGRRRHSVANGGHNSGGSR